MEFGIHLTCFQQILAVYSETSILAFPENIVKKYIFYHDIKKFLWSKREILQLIKAFNKMIFFDIYTKETVSLRYLKI